MTWNYRIIRKTRRVGKRTMKFFDIHEVYYDKNGKPYQWTLEPVDANGNETVKDVRIELAMMLTDALKHPVLEIVGKKLVTRGSNDNG